MNNQETLTKVSDAILEKPVVISVDVNPQNWYQRLARRWGILPEKRVFTIRPICLGSLTRISPLLLSINFRLPAEKEDIKGALLDLNYEAISKHATTMATIVAMAIQNNRQEPSKKLIRFILESFTTKEMQTVLGVVITQMDLSSFMSSIISIRGLNVLESRKPASAENAN